MMISRLMMVGLVLMLPLAAQAQSQPLIVLEYPGGYSASSDSDNPFVQDENYSAKHRVQSGETLSHVMEKHYAGSGLNMRFIEMAIVMKNKHAFVRNNPHYLYADKTLHLPSLNEIKALIMGQTNDTPSTSSSITDQIFFFGS
ncbi:FimV family protein [Alphaproteobacteria bacterium LSUCC0684]